MFSTQEPQAERIYFSVGIYFFRSIIGGAGFSLPFRIADLPAFAKATAGLAKARMIHSSDRGQIGGVHASAHAGTDALLACAQYVVSGFSRTAREFSRHCTRSADLQVGYSYRSAVTGLTRAALDAGTYPATNAIIVNAHAAATIVTGSFGETPYN